MKHSSNEITLYYNPDVTSHVKTLAYAHSVCPHVNAIDFAHEYFTPRRLEELISNLGIRAEELVNINDEEFQEHYSNSAFEENDWLKILVHQPQLIKAPIAIMGDTTMLVKNPVDILSIKENVD